MERPLGRDECTFRVDGSRSSRPRLQRCCSPAAVDRRVQLICARSLRSDGDSARTAIWGEGEKAQAARPGPSLLEAVAPSLAAAGCPTAEGVSGGTPLGQGEALRPAAGTSAPPGYPRFRALGHNGPSGADTALAESSRWGGPPHAGCGAVDAYPGPGGHRRSRRRSALARVEVRPLVGGREGRVRAARSLRRRLPAGRGGSPLRSRRRAPASPSVHSQNGAAAPRYPRSLRSRRGSLSRPL